MKPARFEYARPATLDEAVALLAEHGDEAKVLAGGQSLVPLLNMRLARPTALIDINHVVSCDNVHREGDQVRVGALVRQAAAAGISALVDRCLPFAGHVVTRNRGTVGGSIAHADSSAELPLAFVTLGGTAVARSASGSREIAADDFFRTHFTTSLGPTEILVETLWSQPASGAGHAFEEFALRRGDYALAMAACVLRVDDGRAAGTRVAIGAVVDRPTLLDDVAAIVDGNEVTPDVAREAGLAAKLAVDPPDGLHASGRYRRELTGSLIERAVLNAWRDATGAAT